MNWDDLQVFLAIARAGRVSAAARRLGVEHTTVSRRLKTFESQLGVPLFYRTAAGYLLTSHGKNVLASAEAMEHAAVAVSARAREGSESIAGRVRIAMPPEFASHWLTPGLPAFRSAYPDVELDVLVGTRERDLSRGEADLAIQSPLPRQQIVIATRMGRTSVGLYAARRIVGHSRMRVTSAKSLRGLPLLAYTPPFQLLQDGRWFQPVLASASIALETNSTHVLLAAAIEGLGVAVLPRLVARSCPDLVSVSENVAEHDVWLITHPDFRRDPRVRATAAFLKRLAAGPNGLC